MRVAWKKIGSRFPKPYDVTVHKIRLEKFSYAGEEPLAKPRVPRRCLFWLELLYNSFIDFILFPQPCCLLLWTAAVFTGYSVFSFLVSFLLSACTSCCLSFDMTSLSSDKWERRPHKNSDVLYRWHWDSLFRFLSSFLSLSSFVIF